jgi:hypothetical protein
MAEGDIQAALQDSLRALSLKLEERQFVKSLARNAAPHPLSNLHEQLDGPHSTVKEGAWSVHRDRLCTKSY